MSAVDVLTSDTTEDHFDGNDLTHETEFDLDDLTEVSESTIDSGVSLKTKHKNKAKKNDKGYEKKTKIIKDKKIIIDTYHTNDTPGCTVRHAATGFWMKARVGSIEENLYFKVRDNTSKDSRSLYYDSPEEYERHMFLTLSTEIKSRWTEKFAETQKYLRSLEN